MATMMTAQWIERLPVPAEGRTEHFDTKVSGLLLRVSSRGRKTWYVMYRAPGSGSKRRVRLGDYPKVGLADARDAARKVIGDAATGRDLAAELAEEKKAPRFAEVAEQYLELHARPHKKSWQQDDWRIRKHLVPAWGTRRLTEIRRKDVVALLDQIARTGPIEANRTLALIRKMFNWAIGRDLVEFNPCTAITAPGKERQRERVLSDDEIRTVWQACETLGAAARDALLLRLITAQRGGEVIAMRWQDLDLEAGWWTIPGSDTKNGLAHRVPLTAPALAILRRRREEMEAAKATAADERGAAGARDRALANSPWVFPGRTGTHHLGSVHGAVDAVRKATGLDFTGHDLRRTAASHMASMGISRLVIGKVLNHVEPGVTRVYDRHSYDAEKREALDRWAERLEEIIGTTVEYAKLQPPT